MGKEKLTPAMRQWASFKRKYPDACILFQMGDFYELFDEDAIQISEVLDIRLTSRGKNEKKHPLAGFPIRNLDTYLPKLIDAGYKVVIVEQEDSQSGKVFERSVTRVVTSGTVIEGELLDRKQSNYLMAISQQSKKNGYAIVDISTGDFFLSEVETEKELLDEIVKFAPAEVLVDENIKGIRSEIAKVVQSKVYRYEHHNFEYSAAYESLLRKFEVTNLEGFGCEDLKVGIACAGAILNYLKGNLVNTENITSLQVQNTKSCLIIDSIARKNLELELNLRARTEDETLLWLLDKTITSFGGRCLRRWLREPLIEKEEIEKRLNAVEEINGNLLLKTDLRDLLDQFIDLERMSTKIIHKRARPRDLLSLKESLKTIPQIRQKLEDSQAILLKEIRGNISDSKEVVNIIEQAIMIEDVTDNITGIIKPGYNKELDELRDIIETGVEWLNEFEERERKKIETLAEKKGKKALGVKVGYTKTQGYFIEASNRTPVPDNYKVHRGLKNRTRYRTDELDTWVTKLMNAEEDIKLLEDKVFNNVLEYIKERTAEIKRSSRYLAYLDVLTTFSEISELYNYVKPTITEDTIIKIESGRHPVVERLLPEGGFVPNGVNIGDKHRLIVVTGANMGGKSVYLRQTALISIMAQIGCFVPATTASIGIVDRIFTRVGVVDDITRQKSHFLVEMNETANILHNSTERSLVLLDEIGRGTDSAIGMSLAWAIARYVYKINKARTLFATHFHALNKLETEFDGIKNVHMAVEEKQGELIFLWKVLPGGTSESYGLEVAKLAGIPEAAIMEARKISDRIERFGVFDRATKDPTKKQQGLDKFFGISSSEENVIHPQEDEKAKKAKKIISELLDVDINHLTPVEAIEVLNDLINKARREL